MVFTDLSLDDPNAIERGSEAEATAKAPGQEARPQAALETQDCSIITTHKLINVKFLTWQIYLCSYLGPIDFAGQVHGSPSCKVGQVEGDSCEDWGVNWWKAIPPWAKHVSEAVCCWLLLSTDPFKIKVDRSCCFALSLLNSLKAAFTSMDDHYDVLAASLAKLRASPKPTEMLLFFDIKMPSCRTRFWPTFVSLWIEVLLRLVKNIGSQLEYAEVLCLDMSIVETIPLQLKIQTCGLRGSKATRAEVSAQ